MRLFPFLLLITGCVIALSRTEKCEVTQEDCENMTSEYEKYRACMERRTKRSADCYGNDDYNCDDCDCNTCSYNKCENCSNNYSNNCCSQCCERSSCRTYNCCHQTCRAECKSNSCRTSCKKKCQEKPLTISSQLTDQIKGDFRSDSKTSNHHNITTVIHLNNVINNTNLINLPISLNNRVLNNITNEGARGGSYGSLTEETTKENCCLTIGPRQCIPQKTFPFMRCFHIRKKSCGSICSAPVVHYEKHEICDNDVNVQQPCRQQIIYVPQPQPRCAYQAAWPYVACGNQEMQSCEGCYSHYVKREDVTKCSNFCYDDGYGVGPYYRQGPFYRPGFAHVPSCYQTGTCGLYEGLYDGYGYGYEGFPENGFPPVYPPQTYPFVIEDCENCSSPNTFDSPNHQEPLHNPNYKNLDNNVQWSNVSDKVLNIDAKVKPVRSERYAEIRIKPEQKAKLTANSITTEKNIGSTVNL